MQDEGRRTLPAWRRVLRCAAVLSWLIVAVGVAGEVATPAAGEGLRGAGACRCGRNQVEIAIVLDLSGSMGLTLNTCKAVMGKIIDVIDAGSGANTRVSVVAFRTYDDPEFKIKTLALTSDRRLLHEFLSGLKAEGGGDECGAEALQEAVERLGWTQGARKVVIFISDEKIVPEKQKLFTATLLRAREKGIAAHFVTPSKSAWNFFINDEPAQAKQMEAQNKQIAESFRIPMWDASAALTGGISVGFSNVSDLSRWLLAFALGLDEQEGRALDIKQLDRPVGVATAPPETTPKPQPPAVLGQLQVGGDWNADHAYGSLWRAVKARIDIDADSAVEKVTPDSPLLAKLPVLYWSIHTATPFDAAAREKLRKYMHGGGLIWADACCTSLAYEKAMLAWIEELRRGDQNLVWTALKPEHSLFHAAYDIASVQTRGYATGLLKDRKQWPKPEDDSSTQFTARPPELWGLLDRGRLCLVYSAYDLGAAWKTLPFQSPCGVKVEDGLKLSTNIIVYAVHRGSDE